MLWRPIINISALQLGHATKKEGHVRHSRTYSPNGQLTLEDKRWSPRNESLGAEPQRSQTVMFIWYKVNFDSRYARM